MTKRAPSSNHQSVLPIRENQPSTPPAGSTAGSSLELRDIDSVSVSGEMSAPRATNRACASCIANLTPAEIGQANWHLASTKDCMQCSRDTAKPEAYTKPFCDFLQENPTVFHATDYFARKLRAANFQELSSRDSWASKLQPGGKYYTTRNGSSLIAFTVGRAYKPGNGIGMIGGHIDALTARLKPVSTKPNKAGYVQLGVAQYAGGLNQTWWDRDLSIGGRVVVRDEHSGKTATRLVKLDWPIAKIPTLAPHFGVGMFGKNNRETQAVPVIGLTSSTQNDDDTVPLGPVGSFVTTQPPRLVRLIAKQLGINNFSTILNWELELFDTQPAQTLGMDREFISAGRIDDKLCSWSALMGLLSADNDSASSGYIKLVALFDDEEIGSELRQGARGNFLPQTIERAVEALGGGTGPGVLGQTYARSFLVSADVTHAGNPNFLETYLDEHVPQLNVGITIAGDSNGHMTTDAVSTAVLLRVAELIGAQTQNFQIRNDSRSGGTIGPALSSAMGVRSADAGLPQLSMHSVRATTGALDPGLGVHFFKGFLDKWEQIDKEWS